MQVCVCETALVSSSSSSSCLKVKSDLYSSLTVLCLLLGQIFPDEGHFLSQQSHLHLYATLTSFYRECLKEELLPLPDEEEEEE